MRNDLCTSLLFSENNYFSMLKFPLAIANLSVKSVTQGSLGSIVLWGTETSVPIFFPRKSIWQ